MQSSLSIILLRFLALQFLVPQNFYAIVERSEGDKALVLKLLRFAVEFPIGIGGI
jgi:hypothetical protein